MKSLFSFLMDSAINWLAVCGFVKLIVICFEWTFSWRVATGIWLMACLVRFLFINRLRVLIDSEKGRM